ncbi:MAG: 3-isopropylmalate dehydrogenase [Chloroflexota bacterium]
MSPHVVLLPGDGIGPEVVSAAVQVLRAATDLDLQYETLLAGGAAIDAYDLPLRPEDLERCRTADAVLLGAVGGPAWDDLPVESRPERALLQLRSALGLGINLRPVTWTPAGGKHSPLKPEVASGTDIAFIRELTGGVYFGTPSYVRGSSPNREAVDTGHYTEAQITAVLDFACDLARRRRGKVTSVDKANVLNTSRLWRQVATEYGKRHPDVELEHALVDSFAMALMQNPTRYDVVVTENLFGDILTDLASVVAGSLGVLPSASLRPGSGAPRFGMYEPVHGSAPTIAGQNAANPVGCILSAALMLELSFDQGDAAQTIRDAVTMVMASDAVTADLGGPASTSEFTQTTVNTVKKLRGTGEHRSLRHHVA